MKKNIKKWLPIAEAIYQQEKVTKLFCEYAEHHNRIESKNSMSVTDISTPGNSLPAAVNAFSKINITDIEIELIETGFDTINFSTEIETNGDIKEYEKILNGDIKEYEKILINKLTSFINEQILVHSKLQINLLIGLFILDGTKLTINTNIKFIK